MGCKLGCRLVRLDLAERRIAKQCRTQRRAVPSRFHRSDGSGRQRCCSGQLQSAPTDLRNRLAHNSARLLRFSPSWPCQREQQARRMRQWVARAPGCRRWHHTLPRNARQTWQPLRHGWTARWTCTGQSSRRCASLMRGDSALVASIARRPLHAAPRLAYSVSPSRSSQHCAADTKYGCSAWRMPHSCTTSLAPKAICMAAPEEVSRCVEPCCRAAGRPMSNVKHFAQASRCTTLRIS